MRHPRCVINTIEECFFLFKSKQN